MANRAVVLDTNLLLLLVVGQVNRSFIGMHKRLHPVYTDQDYDVLTEIVGDFSRVILTPHILAETSNWIDFLAEPARTKVFRHFGSVIAGHSEIYIKSTDAALRHEFTRLGLTDSALLQLAAVDRSKRPATLLTVDMALAEAAGREGLPVLNFRHLLQERS